MIEQFWTVYRGNDYASIPGVHAVLQSAIKHDRYNARLYALPGATHFRHVGEYTPGTTFPNASE